MAQILIVDDRAETRQSLGTLLRVEGHAVTERGDITAAITAVRAVQPDLVLSDVFMEREDDGFTLLRLLQQEFSRIPVILYTALACVGDAVRAVKLGASNYLAFPVDPDVIVRAVEHALEKPNYPGRKVKPLRMLPRHEIVAESPRMRAVLEWTERIASTGFPVILIGETGTGKELFARAIHAMSPRQSRPFVPINCGAIPEGLCEAELFGYRRGAFTGAQTDKPGLFEEADGGTLFLDEVAELPLNIQPRLLRFLENGEVRRLGETRIRQLDVRVVAAGNRSLSDEVAQGRFRSDLYFRLSRIACRIPPLREHLEDLEPIIEFWLPRLAKGVSAVRGVSPGALELLRGYSWPGNIRELRNVLEHAISVASGDGITEQDIASALGAPVPPKSEEHVDRSRLEERERLLSALAKHRWRPGPTAATLGISRVTLWRRLRKHGIERSYGRS